MANLGEVTEIVNSSEATLEVGSDTYITVHNTAIHISRPEDKTSTTDAGALWTYGKADITLDISLSATTPELDSLNTLMTLDSDGDMTSTAWKLVYRNLAGATKTFACTGFLRSIDIGSAVDSKVDVDLSIRVNGDTITVS